MEHQALAREIARELQADEGVLALILYGSLARQEETPNSDIDLLVIVQEDMLEKRHVCRRGITVELVTMHSGVLRRFIAEREVPMLFALAEGIVLINRLEGLEALIYEAKALLREGPATNPKWALPAYRTKKRSQLTEYYLDLLDVQDETAFGYITSLLLADTISILLERQGLWSQSRKRMMAYVAWHCAEAYQSIAVLLGPASLAEKRVAAKALIEEVMRPYGGVLQGDAVIFRVENG